MTRRLVLAALGLILGLFCAVSGYVVGVKSTLPNLQETSTLEVTLSECEIQLPTLSE